MKKSFFGINGIMEVKIMEIINNFSEYSYSLHIRSTKSSCLWYFTVQLVSVLNLTFLKNFFNRTKRLLFVRVLRNDWYENFGKFQRNQLMWWSSVLVKFRTFCLLPAKHEINYGEIFQNFQECLEQTRSEFTILSNLYIRTYLRK